MERERRWGRPAGLVALLALALIVASFLARAQIPAHDAAAAQLPEFDSHSGALAAFSILAAIGFSILSVPLLYLFRAAQARSPRVQSALVAFCFIGPVLYGAQFVVNWIAISGVASDFVAQQPGVETKTYDQFTAQVKRDPESIDKVTVYTDANGLDVEGKGDALYEVPSGDVPADAEAGLADRLDAQHVDNEEDSTGAPGDVLASRISDDSTVVQVGSALLVPAALGLIIALVYVPLQSLRVGLLTRFFATLGMALGVSTILLPQAPVLIALWFAWLGLIFLDRTPRGRPPAWDAGEAVPWPPPGSEPSEPTEAEGTIEGSATEVAGTGGDSGPSQSGSQKRKRKRRR
jgi:hypothetical protein